MSGVIISCSECGATDVDCLRGDKYRCNDCGKDFVWGSARIPDWETLDVNSKITDNIDLFREYTDFGWTFDSQLTEAKARIKRNRRHPNYDRLVKLQSEYDSLLDKNILKDRVPPHPFKPEKPSEPNMPEFSEAPKILIVIAVVLWIWTFLVLREFYADWTSPYYTLSYYDFSGFIIPLLPALIITFLIIIRNIKRRKEKPLIEKYMQQLNDFNNNEMKDYDHKCDVYSQELNVYEQALADVEELRRNAPQMREEIRNEARKLL